MPTAGDYEIEFFWYDGNVPDDDHKDPVWWENGPVCKVRLDDIEVLIYKDGATELHDSKTDSKYWSSGEFPPDLNGDKALYEAGEGDDPRLYWEHNPWFDLYSPSGEHLDMISHDADDAFESACDYVISEFVNLCQIENNQVPQVEGRRVVVMDFDEE